METPTEAFPSKSYALTGKIMLTSILTLFSITLLFLLLLHLYSRFCLRPRHVITTPPPPPMPRGIPPSVPVSEPSLSVPTPECAVCLSEVRRREEARLLPGCGHVFHVRCVDAWFRDHATCPVCRSRVEKTNADANINTPSVPN